MQDSTEMSPTRGYTSQRTWIYNSIINTVILSKAWKPLVSLRELQRCYLGARQGLSWEEMDLRAIMKFSPFFDSLIVLSGSRQRRALGHRSQAGPGTAQGHSALGSWRTHHLLLQMAPEKLSTRVIDYFLWATSAINPIAAFWKCTLAQH